MDNNEPKIEASSNIKVNNYHPKAQAIAAIILLVMATGCMYLWQNNKIKNLNSQISNLKDSTKVQADKISSQTAKITDLEKQITALQPVTQPVSLPVAENTPDLKVTIKSATRISTMYSGKDYVAITVSLSNSGSASVPFNLSSFKLTDGDNNKYPSLKEQNVSDSDYKYVVSILNLPKNSTLLTDQTVNKGETDSGILVFYAANTVSDFNLSYQGTNYPITLN